MSDAPELNVKALDAAMTIAFDKYGIITTGLPEIISAYLAALREAPVAVKALEWEPILNKDNEHDGDKAKTSIGGYTIGVDPFSYSPTTAYYVNGPCEFHQQFVRPEAAKAAAQADYETRIRSALTASPAGAPVDMAKGKIIEFATAILHGDDEHRGWLMGAALAFNAGDELPAPRGKGTASPASHGVVKAATAVLASWDARMHGEREELRNYANNPYWSPRASMVDSEAIAALRADLAPALAEPQGVMTDLLAVMKKIVFNWDGEQEDMDEAREAIAKAEGRSPLAAAPEKEKSNG